MDGYGVLDWIGHNMPAITVVIISMHSSTAFAKRAKELGARAFVAKEDAANEIHNALLTPPGIFYMSASVGVKNRTLVESSAEDEQAGPASRRLHTLTRAEHRVLEMVAQSLTSREIAARLGLSYRTVQTHRQRINQKLGLKGPNALLQFALRHQ